VFAEMERNAMKLLRDEGFSRAKQRHERSLSMRYRGQSFELEVKDTTGDIAASFHRAHHERYGYAQEENEIEIVSARLRSSGLVPKLPVTKIAGSRGVAKPHNRTTAYFNGRKQDVGIYRRDELRGGVKLKTPCIVTEYSATTLIPADARARIDQFGNILIEL
jgi:N-methylhydantoinase A